MGTGVLGGGDDGLGASSGPAVGKLFEVGEGEEEEEGGGIGGNSKTRRGPAGFNGNVVLTSSLSTSSINGRQKPAFKTGLDVGKV